jgi:hypothetical protein
MAIDLSSLKIRSATGEKENPHLTSYGNDLGEIQFGVLRASNPEVTSSDTTAGVHLQGYNSLHYMTFEADGPRAGWTLNRCPGPYQIISASNNAGVVGETGSQTWPGVGYFLLAENGDIVIRAPKGRIRMSALDIDIRADGPDNTKGSINLDSNQSVNIKTQTFDVSADSGIKIFTPKSMNLVANTSMAMVSNFINGLTAASANKPNKSAPATQSSSRLNQYYV